MDFLSAIQSGIKRSDDVKRAHAEVKQVLEQVSDAIMKHTKGELKLVRTIYSQRADPFMGALPLGLVTLASLSAKGRGGFSIPGRVDDKLPEKVEQPNALILVHPSQRGSYRKVFAKWDQDPLGYPCVITSFYGYEYVCGNKSELNSAFYAMLMHPGFNELVKSVVPVQRFSARRDSEGPGI